MKRIIRLTESERNRILGMHKSATSKHYLIEQTDNPTFINGDVSTMSWNDATIKKFPKWDGFFGAAYFDDLGITKIINHYDGTQSDSQRGEPNFTVKDQLLFAFNVVKPASESGNVNFTISKDGKVVATSQNFSFGGGNERSNMVHTIKVFCKFPKPLQGNYVINNSLDPQYYLEIFTQ